MPPTHSRLLSPSPLATALILLCFAAMALQKIQPVDMPTHLATGRIIVEQGTFPVVNTFSWTWPDYPLYQQYPLFQVISFLVWRHLGWAALSLTMGLTWVAAVLAWLRLGGPWRVVSAHPLWVLLMIVGVQRHMLARPEALTLLLLGLLLLGVDRWRRGQRGGLLGVVGLQWLLVNTHQMFPLGVALQITLLIHLGMVKGLNGRLGVSTADRDLPLWEPLAALAASVVVLAIGPLGLTVYTAPLATLATLMEHGQSTVEGAQAAELAPVWTDPIAGLVVLLGTLGLLLGWARSRHRWEPLDLGIWAMGVAMVAMAVRGIPFFAVTTAAVALRMARRSPPLLPRDSPVHPTAAAVSAWAALGVTAALYTADPAFLSIQPGLGRTQGDWADDTLQFLNEGLPPGPMINLGWFSGNPLIWGLFPKAKVFVDPRWETYPKPFLHQAIGAMGSDALLAELIEAYQPGWMVAEMRLPEVQARVGALVRTGDWALVHVDTVLVVLVRRGPQAGRYLRQHELRPDQIDPADWLPEHPTLYAQQQIRVGRLLRELGEPARAEALFEAARAGSAHPAVLAELEAL